jgi:hypothetical protein
MAQTIKLKRSSTSGAVPTTSQLELGEVAINTYDGKMYIKKNVGGTETIVDITGGGSSSSADSIVQEYQYTATANQTTFSGADDNSETLAYTAGAIQIFLNGVLLDPSTDYTASNTINVVLTSGAAAGDYLQIFAFKKKISDGNVTVNTFSGNNSTTAFTLSLDPGDENNTRVFVDGVYQSKSNYSVSGTTLTFSTAPPSGTAIEVEIGNRNVTLDTASNLDLPDNVKLRLGTSQDLEIYHDASDSYITDVGTGNLKIQADDLVFKTADGTKEYLKGTANGSVRIRHNNNTKFETTSTGVDVTGNIVVSGTVDGRDVASDGAAAVAALPRTGGAMTGAITTNSTFDGRDVATDGAKLDGIEAGATADQTQSEINALGITATGLSGTPAISVANITTTGELRGPASLVIDPAAVGDNTGTVIIKGNLQVDGATTTINSTTLTVDDLNLTLASGAANGTAANGAGITVDGASATLTYQSAGDNWAFNKNLDVTGNIAVSGTVDGVDIAARDAVLTSTTTTANAALPKAGGTMTGGLIVQAATGQLRLQGTSNTNKNVSIFYNESADYGQINVDESGVNQKDLWITGLNLKFGRSTSSESMRIDSSGDIRLTGTAPNPEDNISTINFFNSSSSLNLASITGKRTAGGTNYGSLIFNTTSSGTAEERMRIDSSGNVGIGTTAVTSPGLWYDANPGYLAISHWATPPTPAAMLHLSDNANDIDVPQIRIEGRENPGDTRLDIAVKDPQVRFNLVEGATDAAAGYGLMTFKTNAAANSSFPTRGGFIFETPASSSNLVITNTGNVGIGTTSPGHKLSFGANIPSDGKTITVYEDGNIASGIGVVAGVYRNFTNETSVLSFGHYAHDDGTTYTERMRIDSSGHVGIRTTPSAWGTAYAVLDLNTGGSIYGTTSGVSTASNLYFTGSAWLAKTTGLGTLYAQHTGKHLWYSSASASAGSSAALSQKMELDASGNLVVGTTSHNNGIGRLTVRQTPGAPATSGSTASNLGFRITTNTSNSQALDFGVYNTTPYGSWIQAVNSGDHSSNYPILLNPNGGKVGIGTATPGTYQLAVNSGTAGVSNALAGIYVNGQRSGVVYNLVSNNTGNAANRGSGIQFRHAGFLSGAIIHRTDGTAASGDAPGYMTFHTSSDNSEDLAERMRILSDGSIKHFSGAGTLHLQALGGSSNLIEGTGSLKIKAASGSVDLLNGSLESLNTTAQGITVNGPNSADLIINAPTDNASLSIKAGTSDSGAEEAVVTFYQNTSPKWQMGNITTNEFRLYNYATSSAAILVDTSSNVLQSGQSRFQAYGGSTGYNPLTYSHSVKYPSTSYNIGSDYSGTTGLYTAPQDGYYIFEASIYSTATVSNGWGQAWLTINGGRGNFTDKFSNTASNGGGVSIISTIHTIYLSQGDTVGYHPYTSSGSGLAFHTNVHHTWFRGRFIG